MKVLILEDNDEYRIPFFKNVLNKHELFITGSIEEAKKIYNENQPFDWIFLDHDLDHRVFVDSEEKNTGYQFAKFLKEVNTKAQIVIHTENPAGSQNMFAILPQAQIVPFPQLKVRLKG